MPEKESRDMLALAKINAHEKHMKYMRAVVSRCMLETSSGQYLRGVVPRVKCNMCGALRWDDGTKCKASGCGSYQQRHVNMAGEDLFV
jgi:hypothetical protein